MPSVTTKDGRRPRSTKASKNEIMQHEMKETMFTLFTESQHHISSHRKNVHALRHLHLEFCSDEQKEEQFFLAFLQCLNIILSVRRNEDVVTKMMRFIIGFVVLSAEKGSQL